MGKEKKRIVSVRTMTAKEFNLSSWIIDGWEPNVFLIKPERVREFIESKGQQKNSGEHHN